MSEHHLLFKTILIGNSGVGKTSIINRYVEKIYTENFISTIGVDFKIKTISVDDNLVKLQIWDTAGQERFRSITTSYYRGSQCIFIVFDVTDTESFTDIPSWIREIRKKCVNDPLVILLGNKIDEKDKIMVTEEEIYQLIEKEPLLKKNLFTYISAKEDTNIEDIFTAVVMKLIERVNIKEMATQPEFDEIEFKENNSTRKCC